MRSLCFSCSHNDRCSGTCVDIALLVLRIAAGLIFLIHGWGKVFGGGPAAIGIDGFTGILTTLGVPAPALAAWIVSLVELLGGVALILGAFVRPFAILLAVDMLVAFALVKQGFPQGDVDFALFSIAVALALTGGGTYALLRTKHETPPPPPSDSAHASG